jgi:hypothetical protein
MPLAERLSAMELRRLVRDTEADLGTLDRLREDVDRVAVRPAGLGVESQAFLAVRLHGWYTAFESALERIARTVEGSLPAGPASHRDLLRGMSLRLSDVRPDVIAPERLPDLVALLAFRHFFRHVYAVDLEETLLRDHAARLLRVHPQVRTDLLRFLGVVEGWIEKLEGGG